MTEWKIQTRATACQACGSAFADKAPYFTLLFDKRQTLDRLDVCPACWESQYSQGVAERKGFVSFWQGVYSVPPPPPPEPIQKESAESLLRKLMEQNDARYQAACFILAVMLERKRVFKVKTQSVEDGHRVLCYEHPRSGDLFTVLDPGLQLGQLDLVQQQVAELLEHGLPVEAAPPPSTEPAASETAATVAEDAAGVAPEDSPAVPSDAPAAEPAVADAPAAATAATMAGTSPAAPPASLSAAAPSESPTDELTEPAPESPLNP